ncbi:MAG: YggU family protein [Nanoarchaeota archaeon]|nr:YggU family protein [Nanoarchaeota archaeon]
MQFKSNPFKILVRTNMPKTGIIGYDDNRNAYRMNVHAQPEKGKANIEIIKFFRKTLKKDVKIISGKTSKEKLVRIE